MIDDVIAGRRRWWVECCDVLDGLRALPAGSVNCVVTSPPYWGLRDYGVAGQIGLEPTHEQFVARLVEVFAEVRRVLRDDGTLWLNLGDAYANDTKWGGSSGGKHVVELHGATGIGRGKRHTGLKPKDLVGIPWRVAFALQEDGWYLRSDVIWAKPNPMPESVTDRPTKAHEYLFLLTKSARYFYDADAIKEPASENTHARGAGSSPKNELEAELTGRHKGWGASTTAVLPFRNRRSVWSIPTEAYPEAHFATFPTALVEPCVLAGCPVDGVVLDPFSGSGTTVMVALRHGRRGIGLELNPQYVEMSRRRITNDSPMFNTEAAS